jgi:integrase
MFAGFLYNSGGSNMPDARLGHASIQMTADTYSHLFPAAMTVPSWRLRNRRF